MKTGPPRATALPGRLPATLLAACLAASLPLGCGPTAPAAKVAPPEAVISEAAGPAHAPPPEPPPPLSPLPPASEAPPSEIPSPESEESPEARTAGTAAGELTPGAPEPESARPASVPAAHPPAPPPFTIRVGLATDLVEVTLPCCDGAPWAGLSGERLVLAGPLSVRAAAAPTGSRWRVQVAALKDEHQARGLARQLGDHLGQPADARFDAARDLYQVRAGGWGSRAEAERARNRLVAAGFGEGWVVHEGRGVANAALELTHEGRTSTVAGRRLRVQAGAKAGVRWQEQRYRGRIEIYLNDRGSLNVVNEVSLEDYLRGVVPKEMGPLLYGELEALKAQTVAARTYTLRHLSEFRGEGFDICATPRCQVYGGMAVEHPLTDRAVAETAGEVVLWQGALADARYTSTCGGHTENVEVVFPLVRDEPYLAGVPCLEGGARSLAGDLPRGAPFPRALVDRVVGASEGAAGGADPRERLARRLLELARITGLPLPEETLASLSRREVLRFVASVFDLALSARLAGSAESLPALARQPPPDWTEEEMRQVAFLVRSGLLEPPLDASLDAAEGEELLLCLAQAIHLLREERVRFRELTAGELVVRERGEERRYPVPPSFASFRRLDGRLVAGPLSLLPGDELSFYFRGDRLVAVAETAQAPEPSLERAITRSPWSYRRSDRQLAAAVHAHYPGLGFSGFEILGHGPSGRVSKVRLLGEAGKKVEVEGLAIRWTFDLPETLFTASRQEPADGAPGWLFRGRGWGHGVGLCQVGAFGMAQRGHAYRDILQHYYSGVEIGRVTPELVPGLGP